MMAYNNVLLKVTICPGKGQLVLVESAVDGQAPSSPEHHTMHCDGQESDETAGLMMLLGTQKC